ncbi:MAG: hypothetical protein Fur0010_16930 [Bdellovibrio sp.]
MKIYGLTFEQFSLLKEKLAESFIDFKNEDLKVYLFGSRSKGIYKKYSDVDIFIKSKVKKEQIKNYVLKLENALEESNLPYKFDIVLWEELFPEYKKEINKNKKLIWSTDEIEIRSPWRVCPIGQHWVRRHDRINAKGRIEDVDGHCRKNRSKKDVLKSDEMELISQSKLFNDSKGNPMSLVINGRSFDNYDDIISGWVAYWNDVFKPNVPLTVELVKILIFTESSFQPNITTPNESKKIGPARGIIQITEQTWRILKDPNGELKDHLVDIKKEELLDPNKNISAGIRWLFRKRETLKKRIKREPTWEEVFLEYKGFYTSHSKWRKKLEEDIKKYKGSLRPND